MPERSDHDLPREGIVPDRTGVRMRCRDCGATFSRRETTTSTKGRLACPECGTSDIEECDRPADR